MSGDYTRLKFDPARGFSGVRKQQGRVNLDSDFNEFEAILDRRDRSAMYDTVGPAVYPSTTPDAFRIGFGVGGGLTIGIGRAYVDGICAECFGDISDLADPTKTTYDKHLGNRIGTIPLPYDKQPFFYAPDFPAAIAVGQASLLYLDVWQREVTIYEDEKLGEPALGGPDTATRMQTAWQVKTVLGDANLTCATDLPESLTARSTARMSSSSKPIAPAPSPCVVSPVGGYTGLENRLYRVEVHNAGTLGGPTKAQFKWSRDNASLAASVITKIVAAPSSHSIITVGSTGRDSWMRFEVDQHLELLDDHIEYAMRETGTGGQLVKILDVNHVTGEILVDKDTSAFPVVAERHPRVRRWDSDGPSEALIRDAGVNLPTELEQGITVTFNGKPEDTLHAGDYWVFAARTVDGTIETLVNEPPRGTHHHFMKLAVVPANATKDDEIEHCRVKWPPECTCEEGACGDCTVCVTPQSHASGARTIQQAVNEVKAAGGGTVCLAPGTYPLDNSGVSIDAAVSVCVRGAGRGSVIIASGDGFAVTNSAFITIEALSMIVRGRPAVNLRATLAATIQRLTVFDIGGGLRAPDDSVPALQLDGIALATTIRDNVIVGGTGIGGGRSDAAAVLTADLRIYNNLIVCRQAGIAIILGGHLLSNGVWSNTVLATQSRLTGKAAAGFGLLGALAPGHDFVVRHNAVYGASLGVGVSSCGFTVAENDLSGVLGEQDEQVFGVLVTVSSFSEFRGDTRISANRIRKFIGIGIDVTGPSNTLIVHHNLIEKCKLGVVMRERGRAALAEISHNQILDVGVPGSLAAGIVVTDVDTAHVDDNTVERVGLDRPRDGTAGIYVVGCPVSRVARNDIDRVLTPEGGERSGVGIAVLGVIDSTQVSGNTVRRQPLDVDKDGAIGFQGIVVGDEGLLPLGMIRATPSVVLGTHGVPGARAIGGTPMVCVNGNVVTGNCTSAAIVSIVFVAVGDAGRGDVVVESNQIRARVQGAQALRVQASSATVSANRLRGGNPTAELVVHSTRAAVVGNLSNSVLNLSGAPLGPPWDALNPSVIP